MVLLKKCIPEAIQVNTTLQNLDFSCYGISHDGIAAITDSLKSMYHYKNLIEETMVLKTQK